MTFNQWLASPSASVQFLCAARLQSLQWRARITFQFPLVSPYTLCHSQRRRNARRAFNPGAANDRRGKLHLGALRLLAPLPGSSSTLHNMRLVAGCSPRGLDMVHLNASLKSWAHPGAHRGVRCGARCGGHTPSATLRQSDKFHHVQPASCPLGMTNQLVRSLSFGWS
jgi:hypothetical protein